MEKWYGIDWDGRFEECVGFKKKHLLKRVLSRGDRDETFLMMVKVFYSPLKSRIESLSPDYDSLQWRLVHRGSSRDVLYEVFESGQRIGSIIRKKLNFIKSGYSLVLGSHAFIDFRLTVQGQVRFTDSDGSEGSIDVDFRK